MPIYFGNDEVSLPGIEAVYYGEDLVYSSGGGIDYLRITANAAGSTVRLVTTNRSPDIEYSLDGGDVWTTWNYSTITLPNVGSYVLFRGDNPDGFSTSRNNYAIFSITGSVAVSGNVMTLIDGVGATDTIPSAHCFTWLFANAPITSAPRLPATHLSTGCYLSMFNKCHDLVTPPDLPAPTLAMSCYESMLQECTSLTRPPDLPAPTLAVSCYNHMMYGCISLKVRDTPAEGATAFFVCPHVEDEYNVENMFSGTGGAYTADPVEGSTYYYY